MIEEQIKELNEEVKVKLAPSSIQGVGVFAICDIKQGERVYCNFSNRSKHYSIPYDMLIRLRPEVRELVLERWPNIINGGEFLSPNSDAILTSFMNHGGDNSNYDPITDLATKDIPKNTEVLEDYRKFPNSEKIYKFLCK